MARKSKGQGNVDGKSTKRSEDQLPTAEPQIKFVLDEATLDFVDNDLTKLKAFIKQLEEESDKIGGSDLITYREYIRIYGKAQERQERLLQTRAKQDANSPVRVAKVDFEVIQQNLLHSFDFNLFKARVLDLFDWYRRPTVMKRFVAPYFPLVQSSGMGKTKLLWELQKLVAEESDVNFAGCACKAILCSTGFQREKIGDDYKEYVFSYKLDVPIGAEDEDRSTISSALDSILEQNKGYQKVILLFDESQHLLKNGGFPFRCVSRWLQYNRDQRVVAVFAGTTPALANFYAGLPESSSSRDPANIYYKTGKYLYEPFWNLCTIGLFPETTNPAYDATATARSDYERAVPYGRPLFAVLQKKGKLTDQTEFNVLRKMLLGQTTSWSDDVKSCLSILSTRLQMGRTSVTLASDLVANGYAVLSHYAAPVGGDDGSACVFFPTDPVCGRLAMAMMDADWEVSGAGTTFRGREKTFWTSKMTQIFSTGLCYPSERDLRELVGALYLLFCGDLVRKSIDKDYKTFSVPLSSFVQCLLKPRDFDNQMPHQTVPNRPGNRRKGQKYRDAHTSFMQVTQNYLHFSLPDFYNQDFLRGLFESGTAFFVHPGFPDIDLVASVRLTTFENGVTYVPLFVSLATNGDKASVFDEMMSNEDLLNSTYVAMRLELLFDRSDRRYTQKSDMLTMGDICCILDGKNVFKTVIVPRGDPFGVTDILADIVWCGSEKSEIYTSHFELYSHRFEEVNSKDLIRKKKPGATLSYVNNSRRALLDLRKNKKHGDKVINSTDLKRVGGDSSES